MLKIVTINYPLEGNEITNAEINSEDTLLDADIVIIDPSKFYLVWTINKGSHADKSTVYSPNSDRIRKIFTSRKLELKTLLENGKLIITFISPLQSIKAQINDINRFDIITNYDILPFAQDWLIKNLISGKSGSNSIKLSNPNSIFGPYFKAFKEELKYTAYLDVDDDNITNNFFLNRSNKPVGFAIQIKNGIVAFLPAPEYKLDNKKLLGILIECAHKFFAKHESTSPPEWISEFNLHGEKDLDNNILTLSKQIEDIIEIKTKSEEQKSNITKFKSLLYEQGPDLENIVIEAFKLFGFNAFNRKLGDLEHDIIFDSKEGNGVAEIEGRDDDSIHIQKLDQLNRAVDEDFDLTGNYPQGILIGNHYRLTKPEIRKEPFTDKVHIVAKKKNFGLITTIEIYNAIAKILENPSDEIYKKQCRERILNTTGEIIIL